MAYGTGTNYPPVIQPDLDDVTLDDFTQKVTYDPADLTTTSKDIVGAINEVDAKVAANQAASVAVTSPTVAEFNALLVKLKAAGLMAADA